jgi:hypothetical protein
VFYSAIKELFASVGVEMLLEYTFFWFCPLTDIDSHASRNHQKLQNLFIKHTADLEIVSRYWEAKGRI